MRFLQGWVAMLPLPFDLSWRPDQSTRRIHFDSRPCSECKSASYCVADASRSIAWATRPTRCDFCMHHFQRGCPILAFFARVGSDAASAIQFVGGGIKALGACIPDSRPCRERKSGPPTVVLMPARSIAWATRHSERGRRPGEESAFARSLPSLALFAPPPQLQSSSAYCPSSANSCSRKHLGVKWRAMTRR